MTRIKIDTIVIKDTELVRDIISGLKSKNYDLDLYYFDNFPKGRFVKIRVYRSEQ